MSGARTETFTALDGGAGTRARGRLSIARLLPYFGLGGMLGTVFLKAEIASWYRMQEMFRFQSFHMYGVIGGALVVAAVSLALIKRSRLRAWDGEVIEVPSKIWGTSGARYWGGGMLFGVGWALAGACPGPMFALIGAGLPVFLVVLASALLGTWTYAHVRDKLPH